MRDDVAGDVLATLGDAPASLLRAFAAGLRFADGQISSFATPIGYLADDLEDGAAPDRLTLLAMRHTLRRAALDGLLVGKLADAEQPFWRSVGDALATIPRGV
jgi:hypothetical protein